MKQYILKFLGLVLLISMVASPVIAQMATNQAAPPPPGEFTTPTRPEPELLPQEILDEFEGGMTIEEFLVKNQGPIPNALLDYADVPVTVVVLLEEPSLIEFVNQEGLDASRSSADQTAYVAQLESGQSAILSQITALRNDITQIGDSFTKVLNGFMLRVPANAINEIRDIAGVKSVTKAPEYEPTLSASVPLINADDVWTSIGSYTGKDVTIAVIDTGIDYTHAMFGGSGNPADYTNNDPDIIEPGTFPTAKVIGGYDFAGTDYNASGTVDEAIPKPDDDPLDEYGHGTHVASIAAGVDVGYGSGVAPDALLYAVKIFGTSGSTNLTLHAIEWSMDPEGLGHLAEPVDVINMSIGSNWGPADETSPEFIAVENATSIGVVVVASAGNSGNSSYIVGSPSTTDSAISVAASTHNKVIAHTIDVTSPSPPPAYLLGMAGVPGTGPEISANIIGEVLWAETVDPGNNTGCDLFPADVFTGAIALIVRGDCTFATKVNNADAAGAIAVIVYNNFAGTPIVMGGLEDTLIEAVMIDKGDGQNLADYIDTQTVPVEIVIDAELSHIFNDAWADMLATFSSRGPRGFDSKLKPEITAPGVAIFAADMGAGSGGVSMGGTSMAAPHIAGVAALMTQANPGWEPVHMKAAMMNTAVDLADPTSAQIPLQGAGRVDAYESVFTSVVAYADPKLVSLSWGVIEINEDYSDTQSITLKNFSDTDITMVVSTMFTSSSTGATLTPAVTSVVVPANGVPVSIDVMLNLDASELPIGFGVGDLEEYYGYVTFSSLAAEVRVPFYFVPRPYTEITEIDSVTSFEINDYGYVHLEQQGPVPSSLWPFPVSLVSGNDPMVLDAGDLRYVGMDYGWDDGTHGDIFVPSFAMWGGVHTNQPYFNEVDLYIDADRDGTPETVNFNFNYQWYSGLQGYGNVWVVIQVDFTSNMLYLGSPYLIYADFNSGFQQWYLPASWNYVVDTFDYEVVSYDWYGAYDYAGKASFDLTTPPWVWALVNDTWDGWQYSPQNEAFWFLFAVPDWFAYDFANIQGVMLVDYHGKPGVGQAYYWPLEVFFNYFAPMFAR